MTGVVLVALFLPARSSGADSSSWTGNGPFGGTLVNFAISGRGVVYAGTLDGGLFGSTDGGVHWDRLNLRPSWIQNLAVSPTKAGPLYADVDRIYRSNDGGRSWVLANGGFRDDDLSELVVSPRRSTTVYAAGSRTIYKTRSAGRHWTALRGGLPQGEEFMSVAVDPLRVRNVYAGSYFAGMFKSSDWGRHWSRIRGGTVWEVAVDPFRRGTVYALTGIGVPHLLRSSNGGRTWKRADAGLPPSCLDGPMPDPFEAGVLYVSGCYGGFFETSDRGGSWSEVSTEGGDSIAVHPAEAGTIYRARGTRIFKSVDRGRTWAESDDGVNALVGYALSVDSDSPRSVLAGTDGGLFRSDDGGSSWVRVTSGIPSDVEVAVIERMPGSPSTIVAGAYGGLYRSTDGGSNWSELPIAPPGYEVLALALDPNDPSTLYAGTDDGLYKTSDGGSTWIDLTPWLVDRYSLRIGITTVIVDPTSPNTLYATPGLFGGVIKSTDGGATWADISNGISGSEDWLGVDTVAIDPSSPQTLFAGGSGVFKTVDGGDHWKRVGLARIAEFTGMDIDPLNHETVYVASQVGVYRSTDGGVSWSSLNAGLPNRAVRSVAVDSAAQLLYAGTYGSSVFVRSAGCC